MSTPLLQTGTPLSEGKAPFTANREIAIQVRRDPNGKYRALPNAINPRYLVPLGGLHIQSRVFALSATSWRSRLYLKAAGLGAVRGERVSVDGMQSLVERISLMLDHVVSLTFTIGTPGAFQKVAALAWSESIEPIAFAKVASTRPAAEKLQNEARMISTLRDQADLDNQLPSVIGLDDYGEGAVLLQSLAPLGTSPAHWSSEHDRFLRRVADATAVRHDFAESHMWQRTQAIGLALLNKVSAPWPTRISQSLAVLEASLCGQVSDLVVAHRDFTPWNTRTREDGTLFVYDWEFAEAGYPIGFDRLHFEASLTARSLGVRSSRRRLQMDRAVRELGIPLWIGYLLDTILFYLSARLMAPTTGSSRFLDFLGAELDLALKE